MLDYAVAALESHPLCLTQRRCFGALYNPPFLNVALGNWGMDGVAVGVPSEFLWSQDTTGIYKSSLGITINVKL